MNIVLLPKLATDMVGVLFSSTVVRLYLLFQLFTRAVLSGYAIYQQLLAAAGESKIFYSDDTGAKILEVMKTNKTLPEKQQRSCNTTTICTRTARGEKE